MAGAAVTAITETVDFVPGCGTAKHLRRRLTSEKFRFASMSIRWQQAYSLVPARYSNDWYHSSSESSRCIDAYHDPVGSAPVHTHLSPGSLRVFWGVDEHFCSNYVPQCAFFASGHSRHSRYPGVAGATARLHCSDICGTRSCTHKLGRPD